jgi:glycerol-3-phosphate dehydrogenase
MLRDTTALTDGEFDLLVIGGGAFGAAAAWDATLRGLRTVLIERSDFGGGASAECFKMVHGGIRYLQHGDVKRLRSSCNERSALLRIAPHLVNPLPIVIPTYGYGRQGKPFLGTGMCLYDLLTMGRNKGIRDRTRHIPRTRFLSRTEVLNAFPDLEPRSLTGAAIFDDGQMYNPARLVLAFAHSAARAGATVCNYVEATKFLWEGKRVQGVQARDRIDGSMFDIRAKLVLNAAGPWAEYLLQDGAHFGHWQRGPFSRDAYFVVNRPPRSHYALAVPGQTRDRDALVSRAARHLFAVPWRNYTLIGVWHKLFAQRPDSAEVEERELEAWLAEINASYPSLQLQRSDVIYANCGLVPFGDGKTAENELSFGKESRFIDHRREHGVDGLVTLIGIRYTTARADSATALDLLLQQLPSPPPRAATDATPLLGGAIADFPALRAAAQEAKPSGVSAQSLDALLRNHGTEYTAVLELAKRPGGAQRLGKADTLAAEVTYAVETEMAMRVEDVVLRRTDLGSGMHPGQEAIEGVANRMQHLLGWSKERCNEEVQTTQQVLRKHRAGSSDTAGKP